MIRIQVKLGEPIWRAVGKRRVEIELHPGATVAAALAHLSHTYPPFGPTLRGETGAPPLRAMPHSVFVNHKLVGSGDETQVELNDGDKLFIFVPIAGG